MLLQRTLRLVLVPLARAAFRLRVEGRENVPLRGPVILAANHLSFIDSFIIPLASPRSVSYLAKAEYFEQPGAKGWLVHKYMTAADAIPVPRGANRAAQLSLDLALGVLAKGGAFGIHPEGSRSRDGRLYRGRTGIGYLAMTSGAPVIPVAIIGTDTVQPVGARFPRLGRVTVRFGAPMRFPAVAANAAQARRAATDEIMAAIQQLSGQQTAPGYNELSVGVQV